MLCSHGILAASPRNTADRTTPKTGDSTNRLTVGAYDPNTTIPESKACCVNLRKADKLTEIG